jgi:hypothetical protein
MRQIAVLVATTCLGLTNISSASGARLRHFTAVAHSDMICASPRLPGDACGLAPNYFRCWYREWCAWTGSGDPARPDPYPSDKPAGATYCEDVKTVGYTYRSGNYEPDRSLYTSSRCVWRR